jgi:hypothetical protein
VVPGNATGKAAAKPVTKPEDSWRTARLIPTTGIGGQDEQEQRATSTLLAVMKAVPQFGRALMADVGAPAGRISTFTEIRFPDGDAKPSIPDGAVVVEWGKKRWTCLVEVKTGGAPLRSDQVARYVDLARANGFDAVLTISNQITASPSELPIAMDARRLKKVKLRHLSWWHVMTQARVQFKHRGVSDPDQAWILGELIAYLDHEKAGAGWFDDMGEKWVAVREGARSATLRFADPGLRDVARRWEQFVQYLALGLTQDLGRAVEAVWAKGDAGQRLELAARRLVDEGKLTGALRVPGAVGPLELEADLKTRLFTSGVELQAPREGKAKTRINWLVRQLKDAPDAARIHARYPNARDAVVLSLKEAREKPERLLLPTDKRRDPKAFRVTISKELGAKRGRGPGSFVLESRNQTSAFYRDVIQLLRPWAAPAPRLPEAAASASSEATPEPPPFSAPDERTFGEASLPEG